ncbi:MAG TPA: glycosyltransferase [Candidatus Eremiobacteraceae bacterium]
MGRVRVAFVHDYLTQFGGAERVLLAMRSLDPSAPVYTSLYDPSVFAGAFDGVDVRTTWLQRVPLARRSFRALLPLYPSAFAALDLSSFDLVISSTSSFAKGVRVRPGALHVSYVHTPTRFLWRMDEYAFDVAPWWSRPLLAAALPGLRRWDFAAAQRPDHIVANSRNVAERIMMCYGRTSDVLHCPAETEAFAPIGRGEIGDYYVVAARLLPYKRVRLAVEACNMLRVPLVVLGSGPDEARLRALAGPTVRFEGHVPDDRRRQLFAGALAIIVPGEEDFGLVPVEAAAAGRPTVAFGAGGAMETVVDGVTGTFFREPTAESLAQALSALDPFGYDVEKMTAHAATFSADRFRAGFRALLESYGATL